MEKGLIGNLDHKGTNMNCKPENHISLIQLKMEGWHRDACMELNESDRQRGRKNFLALIKRYPDLARSLKYSERSVPRRSVLRGRTTALIQNMNVPADVAQRLDEELSKDVINVGAKFVRCGDRVVDYEMVALPDGRTRKDETKKVGLK